ncbi:hypothetical protein H7B90_25175 [Cohnella xylanilytica]|uniref:SWIM-type domain-containing protein n=1 Tax=Cohnella xylanilytica TaxID=557555 RepID=A0A841U9B2_9BACL|nr:SWIM zinc finger family protein [Cohnella xylanilytica]MBB6694694.1 hypothetical protein [Cohnella xylanilytica]
MKLDELEKAIPSVILKRGQAYRLDDRIAELEEVEEGDYRAEVEGSELYIVEVRIGAEGEIEFSSCDCPFAMEAICKHQAAVMLEIRDRLPAPASSGKGRSRQPKKSLADRLAALSKEQLVGLLSEYAKEFREVKSRLELFFMNAEGTVDEKQLIKLIRGYVKRYSERDGFVPYRHVPRAVEGARIVLEKARAALDQGNALPSIRISFCALRELTDLIHSCDDSDGIVGGLAEDGLELVGEAVEEIAPSLTASERRDLLRSILRETELPLLSDWLLDLLRISLQLVNDEETRAIWEASAGKLEAEYGDSYSASFFAREMAPMKYDLVRRFDGEARGAEFLRENMEVPEIREKAIREAIESSLYEEALRLAREGEDEDARRGYPGLVDRWRKLRLEVYRLTGERQLQRELTEEFAVSGDYSYYEELKGLYSPEEWPEVYARVLTAQEQGGGWRAQAMYVRLLVEEKEHDKLLEYVEISPGRIVPYYKELVGPYPEETYRLFERHIEAEAADASNRKQYKQVCKIVKELLKAGGRETAERIVSGLRRTYSKRPAMLEELDKLGL